MEAMNIMNLLPFYRKDICIYLKSLCYYNDKNHKIKGIVAMLINVLIKTVLATKAASLLYFWQSIIVKTAEGIDASSRIMFLVMPVIEKRATIKKPTKKPIPILNKEAKKAILADFNLISVSL